VAAIERTSRSHLARLWAGQGAAEPPFDAFTGDVYLDVVPGCLQDRDFLDDPGRLPVRPTTWSEPGGGLPGWVYERRRPLVYLTLGTVVGTNGDLAPAIAALATLDADVLVALGSAGGGAHENEPANVHVSSFVDQAAVLPRADLVVHHGGSGTVLGALAHARRQLVLPKGADQFLNADVLRASGMALVLEPEAATEQAIATAARAALEAPVPAAVLGARDEIAAMPSPAEALTGLLDRLRWISRRPAACARRRAPTASPASSR
jgi:UDP:flavonoid glycosyltransferase YjiC (YdhE family)